MACVENSKGRPCFYANQYISATHKNMGVPYLVYLDPLMRAAALGQLKRSREAMKAVGELLGLVPDFATHGRHMIKRYVKVDAQLDSIIGGFKKQA